LKNLLTGPPKLLKAQTIPYKVNNRFGSLLSFDSDLKWGMKKLRITYFIVVIENRWYNLQVQLS